MKLIGIGGISEESDLLLVNQRQECEMVEMKRGKSRASIKNLVSGCVEVGERVEEQVVLEHVENARHADLGRLDRSPADLVGYRLPRATHL